MLSDNRLTIDFITLLVPLVLEGNRVESTQNYLVVVAGNFREQERRNSQLPSICNNIRNCYLIITA